MATVVTKPITILHYEDSPTYRDSFKTIAQANRIIVDAVDNVDLLLEKLEEDPRKHKFVVLDARAFLHEGQTSGSESEVNLIKIFLEIDKIAKAQGRIIPFCINTGFADVKLSHAGVVPCEIFEKGDELNLLKYIWESYNGLDDSKLRKQHPGCFEFADTYFDLPNLALLTELLKGDSFESNDIAKRVINLSSLRRLNEHIMDILYIKHLHSPSGVIKSSASRANDIFFHINDSKRVPPEIHGAWTSIYKVASNFGSHTPEEAYKISDYPSANTIIMLTFGLLNIIDWANNLLK